MHESPGNDPVQKQIALEKSYDMIMNNGNSKNYITQETSAYLNPYDTMQ